MKSVDDAKVNSEHAKAQLRGMPQTRDAILHLLLIECALRFDENGVLVKVGDVSANFKRTPEQALARAIAKHLRAV